MGPLITCFQLFPCWGSTTPTVLKQYFSSQARFLPQSLFHSQSPTHPKNIKKSKNGFNSFQAKYQTDTIQIASSYRHAFRTKAATMLQCCKCHACCVCVINCVCDREGWPITCGSIPKNTCGSKYLSKQITCGSKNHLWGWGGAREEKG